MDLRLNEDQEMFKKVAADFVQAEAPTTMLTQQFLKKETFLPDLYAKIAGLGWLGMLMPEQYGGAGLSYLDCGVVFEELGRAPVPGPVFSSGVLAAQIVHDGGSDAQKQELLPAICGGEAIVVPAIGDHGAHWGPETVATTCSQSGDTLTLQGTKRHVYDAEGATAFLCAVRGGDGGVSVVLVDRNAPGVTVTPYNGFMVSVSEVAFDGVQVPARQPHRRRGRGMGASGQGGGKGHPAAVRLQGGGVPGDLRVHRPVHQRAPRLRPAHRPVPAGPGPLRGAFDPHGPGADGHLRDSVGAR